MDLRDRFTEMREMDLQVQSTYAAVWRAAKHNELLYVYIHNWQNGHGLQFMHRTQALWGESQQVQLVNIISH